MAIELDEVDIKNKEAQLACRRTFKNLTLPSHPCALEWEGLHETRKSIIRDMKGLLDRCSDEERDLNETEKIAYRFCEDYLDEIKSDFKRREESGDRSAKDPKAVANPFTRYYNVSPETSRAIATRGKTYREIFNREERGYTGGFENSGEELKAIFSGQYHPGLEQRTWIEGTGSVGGYNVPEILYERIFNTVMEDSVVMPRATVYPMEHGNLTISCFQNEKRATDGLFGGLIPSWLGETVSASDATGKMRTITLTAHKLGLYTEMSLEAANDAYTLESEVTSALSKSVSFYADYYLLRGDGIAKPKGVLNDGAIIKKARTGPGAIAFADIVNMYSSLYGPCVKNAVWVISSSCVPELLQLVDAGNHLIWTPTPVYSGAIAGPVPNTLFGLPVIISEKLPSLGTSGDILLADFSQYAVGITGAILLEKSNAPKWSQAVMSYRALMRLDGCGLWADPLESLNSDQLSWCVCLNA